MGVINTGWTPVHASLNPETDNVPKYDENGLLHTSTGEISGTDGNVVANSEFVQRYIETYVIPNTIARINSPEFTGIPTVPDAAFGTNTTQIANTKFVQEALQKSPDAILYDYTLPTEISGNIDNTNSINDAIERLSYDNGIVLPETGATPRWYKLSQVNTGETVNHEYMITGSDGTNSYIMMINASNTGIKASIIGENGNTGEYNGLIGYTGVMNGGRLIPPYIFWVKHPMHSPKSRVIPISTNAPLYEDAVAVEPTGIVYVEPTTSLDEKLPSDFTPATTLSNLAVGDSVETALRKISLRVGIDLPSGNSETYVKWIKIFDVVGNGAANYRLNCGVSNVDESEYLISCYCATYMTDAEYTTFVNQLKKARFTRSNSTRFGYVYDNTAKSLAVYIKTSDWFKGRIYPLSGNSVLSTFESTTTEPTGIVYVEPTTYAPEKLSSGFTPATTLSNLAPGNTVETSLSKLSSNVIRLPEIAGTETWTKVFDITPTSFHTFNFTLYDGIIDPIQYIISCYSDANTAVTQDKFLQVEKLTRSFYSPTNGARFGYVFNETTRSVQVYVKRALWGSMMICPTTSRGYSIPSTFESITTEPEGIVYVEPTTYAPEKLSSGFDTNLFKRTISQVETTISPGDSIEDSIERLNKRMGYTLPAKPNNRLETWYKIFSYEAGSGGFAWISVQFDIDKWGYEGNPIKYTASLTFGANGNTNPTTSRSILVGAMQNRNTETYSIGYIKTATSLEVWAKHGIHARSTGYLTGRLSGEFSKLTVYTNGEFVTTEPTGIVYVEPTTYAPTASPALTGTPTAPTATAGTNTTQIATTAFVKAAIDALRAELTP